MINLHINRDLNHLVPQKFSSFKNSKNIEVQNRMFMIQTFYSLQLDLKEKEYEQALDFCFSKDQVTFLVNFFADRVLVINEYLAKNEGKKFNSKDPILATFIKNIKQLSNSKSLEILEKKIRSVIFNSLNDIVSPFSINVSQMELELKPQEIESLKGNKEIYKNKKSRVDCISFAFYKLMEKRMIPVILGESTINSILSLQKAKLKEIAEKLFSWNYFKAVNPQKGDLIVYVDKENNLTHMGVLESSDRVVSKWGATQAFSHPIDQLPAHYGSHYLLFRKERGDGLETDLKEMICTIENALSTFSHPVCYSPLSVGGCKSILKDRLVILVDHYKQQAIDRPPHGVFYFQNLRSLFEEKVNALTDTNCRQEIIQLFKGAMRETFDEVDIMQ